MRIVILSIICIAIIGAIVAIFLRFVKYFDRRYEEFEDERFRAAAGPGGEEIEEEKRRSARDDSGAAAESAGDESEKKD